MAYGILKPTTAQKKTARDLSGLHSSRVGLMGNAIVGGIGNTRKNPPEPIPQRVRSENEKYLASSAGGTLLSVSDGDRVSVPESGYGGTGDTQCPSFRLTVGPSMCLGHLPEFDPATGEVHVLNPSNRYDGATLYISQKTNIDHDFGLKGGTIGLVPGRSAAVMKADSVRLISRDGGIKLVAGGDRRNSQGGITESYAHINLVGGNDPSNLQPIVKGASLIVCLRSIINTMNNITTIIDDMNKIQAKFNSALTGHTHTLGTMAVFNPSPAGPVPTGMTAQTLTGNTGASVVAALEGAKAVSTQGSTVNPSLMISMINDVADQVNYLDNLASPSHILSQNVWST